jgi:pyridoxal phosphate enzyme (YggS family)
LLPRHKNRAAAGSVQLLAVSKTFGPEAVLEAVAAGQRAFGENYLQEGLDKIRALQDAGAPALEWHFIGPSRATRRARSPSTSPGCTRSSARRSRQRLSEQRPAGMAPLQICLQVNISGEASKSGVAPEEVAALAHKVAALPNLTLRGLMAIPEPAVEFAQQRAVCALRVLYEQLRADGLALDTLSMGMSADMQAAIVEGATIVRVGSAIFGARNYNKV